MDYSIQCSVLEKSSTPSENRFTGSEPSLLEQNAVALPLAPPPLPLDARKVK